MPRTIEPPGYASRPAMEPRLMMWPERRSLNRFTNSCVRWMRPRTLVSSMTSISSGEISPTLSTPYTSPALFTSTSTSRAQSGRLETSASSWSRCRMSTVSVAYLPPCPERPFWFASSHSWRTRASMTARRAVSTTFAPACANSFAVAAPMPPLAPVTSTTLLCSRAVLNSDVMVQSSARGARARRTGRPSRDPHAHPPPRRLARLMSAVDARGARERAASAMRASDTRVHELLSAADARVAAGDAALRTRAAAAVQTTQERAESLRAQFAATADTAKQLRARVEVLHEERSRVDRAMDWCRQVIQLKSALAALAEALEMHDWEGGVRHCTAALQVDEAIVHSEFAARTVPSAALPGAVPATLASLRGSLIEALVERFRHYTSAGTSDDAQATRFLSYFSPLHASDAGLRAYSDFARTLVRMIGRNVHEQLGVRPAPSPTYYGALLSNLFEQLAVFISKHEPVVDRLFGPGAFSRDVLPHLQPEWDRTGAQVLDALEEQRQVRRKLNEVHHYTFSGLADIRATPYTPNRIFGKDAAQAGKARSAGSGRSTPFSLTRPSTPVPSSMASSVTAQPPELSEVDAVLTELAHLGSQWALFRRFVGHALAPSELDRRIESLLTDTFVQLQVWGVRASIEKAHELDSVDLSARPLATSLPDDLFYMLRGILLRLLSASSPQVVQDLVEQLMTLLESDFIEIVVLRMDGCRRGLNFTRLVEGPRKTAAAREVKACMMVYLNALDVAADYLGRVTSETSAAQFLEQYYAEAPQPDEQTSTSATGPSDLERVQESLHHLGSLTQKMRSALRVEMEELFACLVEARIRALTAETLHVTNYLLDEAAFNALQDEEPVRVRLAAGWDTAMSGFRDGLTEANYQVLFALVLDAICGPWEDAALQSQYTELGALRFDKDLRELVGFLTEQAPWGVRDRFSRLQQIAYVLNADEEDLRDGGDVFEMGVAAGLQWQLTPGEVQAIRKLRVPG